MRKNLRTFWRTYVGLLSSLIACAIILHMVDSWMRDNWNTALVVFETSVFVTLVALAVWLSRHPSGQEDNDQLEEDAEADEIVNKAFSAFDTTFKRPPLAGTRKLVLDDPGDDSDDKPPPAA